MAHNKLLDFNIHSLYLMMPFQSKFKPGYFIHQSTVSTEISSSNLLRKINKSQDQRNTLIYKVKKVATNAFLQCISGDCW